MNKKGLFICIFALAALAFLVHAWTPDPITLTPEIQAVLDQLVHFICWPACLLIGISSSIASLLLILAGARYVAADDPGTRAGLRRLMIGVVIGLLIVLLAVPIINFVIADLLPNAALTQCTCFNASIDNINSVLRNLINALKEIGPWVCAIMVIYGGLRYLTSADDPGARKIAKTSIIAAFVGMIIVMLAIPLVNIVLGDALKQVECPDSNSGVTEQLVTVLGNFLCIFALISPPICALVVTYGGLRYITSADDPGARDAAKTIIISALIGMLLVTLAVPLVNVVLTSSTQIEFKDSCLQGKPVTEITQIMCNFLCFLSYIAPAVCALVVIYGGLRYIVSGDDPGARRTARNIIISAFVGMIFVFISIPIVNLVLTDIFKQVVCDKCQDSQSAKDIVNILCKFICLIASVAPAIAALAMIYGGLRYVTSAEDPGARSVAKTIIISALVGLVLVMISLAMVNMVVSGWATDVQCGCFSVDPVAQINKVLCSLVCTIQMITPAVAALVIMFGGLKYLTSAEDPSARAAGRSIVINAIIGLVIVLLAVQIINAVISGLVPTFKCDCAQLFPGIFSQMTGQSVPDTSGSSGSRRGTPPAGGACSKLICGTGFEPGCFSLTDCQAVGDESRQVLDCTGGNYCCCNQKLYGTSADSEEVCTKCCVKGKDSQCYVTYKDTLTGAIKGETQISESDVNHPELTLITECKASKDSYTINSVDGQGTGGKGITSQNTKGYCDTCKDGTVVGRCNEGNEMCEHNSDGGNKLRFVGSDKCSGKNSDTTTCQNPSDCASLGPTFTCVSGTCKNSCSGDVKCCLTTDKDGHPGCIGTDTQNVVKINTCLVLDDHYTSYACEGDKCAKSEIDCKNGCKDDYSCKEVASPDPGNLGLANPEIG